MKRMFFAGLISVLLLLSASAVSMAVQASKPSNSPPALEKITFVHYLSSSKPTWEAETDSYRFMYGGIKWPATISYAVNPTDSGLGEAAVRETLETSSETWDDATGFELYNAPTITYAAVVSGDDKNTVGWGPLDSGIIAVCTIWFYPATKEIVEFDIIFSTRFDWGIDPDGEGGVTISEMDLQNIATHELGHNGLSDLRPPKDQQLTMYYASEEGETKKRSLGLGDRLGIEELYG